MIKHEPKFYVRLCKGKSVNFPDNFTIYPGSIYGRFQDSKGKRIFWVCDSSHYQMINFQCIFLMDYTGNYA